MKFSINWSNLIYNLLTLILASILQDTCDQNIIQTSTSSSSNGSSTNNVSGNNNNIKIESSNSYYCNSYSSPVQTGPTIAAITSGYSEIITLNQIYNYNLIILVDPNSSFSVILRSNESQVNSHDQHTLQRYATHPATRILNQQQVVSPNSVFFQHSPSTAPDADGQENETPSNNHVSNGHDTLSDFVTFVCQESEQSNQNGHHRNSPKTHQYSQYNAMLPPPPMPAVTGPLPPMAVPVAAGYSGRKYFESSN